MDLPDRSVSLLFLRCLIGNTLDEQASFIKGKILLEEKCKNYKSSRKMYPTLRTVCIRRLLFLNSSLRRR